MCLLTATTTVLPFDKINKSLFIVHCFYFLQFFPRAHDTSTVQQRHKKEYFTFM